MSLATITPSANFTASTLVPVTYGYLRRSASSLAHVARVASGAQPAQLSPAERIGRALRVLIGRGGGDGEGGRSGGGHEQARPLLLHRLLWRVRC